MSTRIPRKALYLGLFLFGSLSLALSVERAIDELPAPEPVVILGNPVADILPLDPTVKNHDICRIPELGRFPWHPPGSAYTPEWEAATQVAYQRMGLPLEAAEKALHAIQHAPSDDFVRMGNRGGTGRNGVTYSAHYNTTYKSEANGRVVCLDSKLAFQDPTKTTNIPVWFIEHNGQTYYVTYFLECDNITRIYRGALDEFAIDTTHMNEVPEPASWLCFLIGFIAAVFWKRK